MEKENVLEIEYQEVFDKIAVRIKYLNDDFFGDGLLKEDVEKYKCSFIESPTDLEEHIIWLYDDIYLSDNNIYCYCEETINKIKEFVDYVNEEYGIPKRWRAETEIRDKLKEYEENIKFLETSLKDKKIAQELKMEVTILKWLLGEIKKI